MANYNNWIDGAADMFNVLPKRNSLSGEQLNGVKLGIAFGMKSINVWCLMFGRCATFACFAHLSKTCLRNETQPSCVTFMKLIQASSRTCYGTIRSTKLIAVFSCPQCSDYCTNIEVNCRRSFDIIAIREQMVALV